MKWYKRTELLVGSTGIEKLQNAHVLVVGLGGVGAYAAETICRAGVGRMTIVDGDSVEMTNRNRQLPALVSNEGKPKAEVMGARFRDINPEIELEIINEYLKDERMEEVLDAYPYDYVVDCIDTLSPKVYLLQQAKERQLPVVSSMGAGGKLDPTQIRVADISKSYNCALAKMIRKRLRKLNINKGIKVVFSPEDVDKSKLIIEESQNKKSTVGTISYMPPAFGCFIGSIVIRDLLEK
ncbi:tRNA threonylcarbamoyladenosine dehydratase [Prolixibacter denitrificans]|uniref:tRNA A37 threonylcarbamoyladenosine dehydratase n=1 Tax=Prolixibacter denitrificans TaxID=1541063 RepID=A0A2P8CBV8_9BACT|nr:tRNA threonylcarbamoyladenosine dehydratase [Prolixibacter denitrificans]PSK82456.1 tRNA A37 threonylcarbamoyladenosine dehydratase [Prolixibacter denitrificans]GET22802.1 tRNA threonylcarbamoyladenosine dehydratase [Prolixibacter denitrificans]